MNRSRQHVVIAGAGIVGLATALELADAGFRVTVIERGHAMEQSSWAAAGMLAVHDSENAAELRPLALFSSALYPAFLARIETLSGQGIPLRTTRTFQGHPADALKQAPPAELPGLCTDHYSYTLLDEASLDPHDLCTALPNAAVAAGVVLREQETVLSVEQSSGHLAIMLASRELVAADHFLLAAGAWSGLVKFENAGALPVAPRKGQMIEVTLHGPVLPMVVRTPKLYLVPRGDGRVVIGATVEHAGFDRTIDEAAGERLWQAAAALWPPVLQGSITARWTGLRPGFQQDLPFEDALPCIGSLGPNIWVATAHFRNGILLAPGTARVLRQLLCGETPTVPLECFAPRRFAHTEIALA